MLYLADSCINHVVVYATMTQGFHLVTTRKNTNGIHLVSSSNMLSEILMKLWHTPAHIVKLAQTLQD